MTKYGNRRVNSPDGWFDSQREYKRWGELKLLEHAGQISELKHHVSYELVPRMGRIRPVKYIADFEYIENGKKVVEDSKGYRNRLYVLKRKLMLYRHNVSILET